MSGLGVVLSGGGARGAYEVGVLHYVFGELVKEVGQKPTIDFISGTSVGAINGTFLASVAHDPGPGSEELVQLWENLTLASVLGFGVRQLTGLRRVLLGGTRGRGVFGAGALRRLMASEINWRQLRRNVRHGDLRALTVTTTHIATGRPHVFIESDPRLTVPTELPAPLVVRPAQIHERHILASAAIPFVFPPVLVDGGLHCDGGLRSNTPMAPTIQLGADRLLVIGVSSAAPIDSRIAEGQFPGAIFLLGKVLNAFLIDHLRADVDGLIQTNRFLEFGVEAYGPGFIDAVNQVALKHGHRARHPIHFVGIQPSEDIGKLASKHLHSNRSRFGKVLGRTAFRMLHLGAEEDSDLASYLLFESAFAKELIALGREDARKQRDQLASVLFPDL